MVLQKLNEWCDHPDLWKIRMQSLEFLYQDLNSIVNDPDFYRYEPWFHLSNKMPRYQRKMYHESIVPRYGLMTLRSYYIEKNAWIKESGIEDLMLALEGIIRKGHNRDARNSLLIFGK